MRSNAGISTVTILVVLMLAAGGFIGWSAYQRYQVKAEVQALAKLSAQRNGEIAQLRREFLDEMDIATATPRMSVSTSISRLQSIRERARSLDVPECLRPVRMSLVVGMGGGIDGMLAFLRNEGGRYASAQESNLNIAAMNRAFAKIDSEPGSCPKVQN